MNDQPNYYLHGAPADGRIGRATMPQIQPAARRVQPNNALFRATLPRPLTWQQPTDLPGRVPVMDKIASLLAATNGAGIVAPGTPQGENAVWILARKLETYLYIQSATFLEYANLQSLPRRVQALTTAIVNRGIRKRGRSESREAELEESKPMRPFTATFVPPSTHHQMASSCLLFDGHEDINKIIWRFVGGKDTLRCRGVCRSAAVQAPKYVYSLHLSCNASRLALLYGRHVLEKCTALEELEIYSLAAGVTFGRRSMFAKNCPQRFVVTHDDHEQIVSLLATLLSTRQFASLSRLSLVCLFTNEQANGEADVLLNCLTTGVLPRLKELCLPGNSFGDYGVFKLAELLTSRVCPNLTHLDLRRNFIGERGVHQLCAAIETGCAGRLMELCLGGNTLTDSSIVHLLRAIESRKMRELRFLGLEMNYLTGHGIQLLGTSIGRLGCPHLNQISYGENAVDDAEAKKILAKAIMAERLRQRQEARAQAPTTTNQQRVYAL
ncbi:hypothetical protein SDRG_05531 [Saprolegnia diclina VS20]|uniref:Uncharacterized protein n=1 Tax=Saprolegnia diclina (strain VS20) TaxID=1156394 RepID=T0QTG3_SAPDV|nr:hypothetical protein SDRG_05531 [Saprolegnia diclina VS20]EQC37310.1 hypothetical protein SDRG_05531 [Saprolegnia diclina VS20]|eukprot:XP_008609472.1 hypothetical protein SDRG_05531 [Saprolegnia diclina VS20]